MDFHKKRSIAPDTVPGSYEVQTRDKLGVIHDGILSVSMISGTSERVVSFFDITEKKKAEEHVFRSQKMAALGQLMAGMAHEINNPNNFIYMNIPVMQQYIEAIEPLVLKAADEDPNITLAGLIPQEFIRDFYDILKDLKFGSTRISEIVKDLRVHNCDDEDIKHKPTSVEDIFRRVMTLTGKQIRGIVGVYRYTIEPDLPLLNVNSQRIEQVLINLVINASHAASKVDSVVELIARTKPRDLRYIEICVQDNGSGIPERYIDQVFDPFFTTKSTEQGSGLGLWICHRIVAEHGGKISVSSRVDEGSSFVIELPIAQESGDQPRC
jgi:signal transduction histidine kinase